VTIRAPRHDETDKGAVERALVTEFAARFRADIDITSIHSGDPRLREPDVITKSTESDALIAFELVRLTGLDETLATDALARKFDKAREGLYAGVPAADLELLAWSDRLTLPWTRVLQRVGERLAHDGGGFTRAWLWNRHDGLDSDDDGVWLWEAGRGIIRFD
jgi:hypothetical protein